MANHLRIRSLPGAASSNYASFTRKGNTLYMHVHFWPGEYVALTGLMAQVKSARMLSTGQK